MLRRLAEQPNPFQVHARGVLSRRERQSKRLQADRACKKSCTDHLDCIADVSAGVLPEVTAGPMFSSSNGSPALTAAGRSEKCNSLLSCSVSEFADLCDELSSTDTEGEEDPMVRDQRANITKPPRWRRGITCDMPSRSPECPRSAFPARGFAGSAPLKSAHRFGETADDRGTSPSPDRAAANCSVNSSSITIGGDMIRSLPAVGMPQRIHGDLPEVTAPPAAASSAAPVAEAASAAAAAAVAAAVAPFAADADPLCGGGESILLKRERRATLMRRPHSLEDIILRDEPECSPLTPPPEVEAGAVQWPPEVLEPLQSSSTPSGSCGKGFAMAKCLAAAAAAEAGTAKQLFLYSGTYGLPHPAKACNGGADSSFSDSAGSALGIADGVGEWEWRFDVNARAFADELMDGCREGIKQTQGKPSMPARERALHALQRGFDSTRSFGSATALVAALGKPGELGVANLGDSTLVQLRRRETVVTADRLPAFDLQTEVGVSSMLAVSAPSSPMCCMARTSEQQHSFNCPYQLARVPSPADFPELLKKGKDKLVRAMSRPNRTSKLDRPGDAELYTFHVQAGDLVILGTDGVFDNLYTHEVLELASHAASPTEAATSSSPLAAPTDPTRIATAITRAAYRRSLDRDARTPFGDRARQAGLSHRGGKMDDVTCVCAWVVEVEAADMGSGLGKDSKPQRGDPGQLSAHRGTS